MAKVIYKQGTKATYLSLLEKNPNALYFCTDTCELFKGNDLFSDGLRMVDSYDMLPEFKVAADGILYFCLDNGCGYVLSRVRDAWIPVIHGVDGVTIDIGEDGLMHVKSVAIEAVTGLADKLAEIEQQAVKGSNEISISEDGTLKLISISQSKVIGLEDRLAEIEQSIVGGIRYRGSVEKVVDLPADAQQGDLYEVREDNSEWCFNGDQWFEYGKTTNTDRFVERDDLDSLAKMVKYEICDKPTGTLVNYYDKEIRVMCPANTKWQKQSVGATGNANMYYMSFKAYAPEGAVSFKEGDRGVIVDEMFTFDSEFAGTDEFGRNYSICWLALALYDEDSDKWTYFGENSTTNKYIGWDYIVEWYDANGIVIASDCIRINLANESCYISTNPYYVNELRAAVSAVEEGYTWGDM